MSWTSWLIVLSAWLSVGVGVAYLFGRLAGGVEAPETTGRLPFLVVLYLRLATLAKTALRTRAAPHTPSSREAGGRPAR